MPYKNKENARACQQRIRQNVDEVIRQRTYAREYARARKSGTPWVNPVPKQRINRKGIPIGIRSDIAGVKFKKLTAVRFVRMEPASNGGNGKQYFWEFKCECGGIKEINRSNITSGKQGTCGRCRDGKPTNPELSARKTLFGVYKNRCHREGTEREFTLSEELFIRLTSSSCAVCGAAPYQKYRQSHSGRESYACLYTGIDRIDNDKGYIEGNVRPCCTMCNKAKHAWPETQFQEWLDRIVNFRTNPECPAKQGNENKYESVSENTFSC